MWSIGNRAGGVKARGGGATPSRVRCVGATFSPMPDPEETVEERAERRRQTWTIQRVPVDTAMQAADSSVAQRVARMWQLSIDPWVLRGEPLPSYTRAEMPGRVIRGKRR